MPSVKDSLAMLRQRMKERSKAALDEALKANGHVSKEKIEELERISSLIGLIEQTRPKRNGRWMVVVLLGVTVVIIGLLMFTHVGQTEIDLDLSCSGVSFVTARAQELLPKDGWELAELQISGGTNTVHLPLTASLKEESISGTSVRIAVDSKKHSGTLNAQTLKLPANTHARINALAADAVRYRVTLQGENPTLVTQLSGATQVVTSSNSLDLNVTDSCSIDCGKGECDLDVMPTALRPVIFSALEINDLSLVSLSPLTDDANAFRQQLSTILSGKLILNSLNGKESTLREGDLLQFKNASGVLRISRSKENQFDIKFTGSVRDLTMHHGPTTSSLMPTWLEWLQARHGLTLLWGTSAYVIALVLGIINWWGKGP